MAYDKKKEEPSGLNLDPVEAILIFIILAALLSGLVAWFSNYFFSSKVTFFGFGLGGLVNFLKSNALVFKAMGLGLAGVGGVGTFVFNRFSDAVWQAERAKLYPANFEQIAATATPVPTIDRIKEKWQKIVEHSNSTDSALWRIAILEADIMLDDLLDTLHLPGETMGDKLKAVERSDFITIDAAWEAHKVRNMIAHEGSDFLLNQREVKRVISLYESVFREFEII